MRGWTDLPVELRQKCIKNMSLMTSSRLRTCSKIDQLVVDTTPIHFPRVKLGQKEERYLIKVYTGIGEFVRIELRRENGRVVLYRSIHTCQKPTRKVLSETNLYEMAFLTFKSICGRQNVSIDTLEENLDSLDSNQKIGNILETAKKVRCLSCFSGNRYTIPENGAIPHKATEFISVSVHEHGDFSMRDPIPTFVLFSQEHVGGVDETIPTMIFGHGYIESTCPMLYRGINYLYETMNPLKKSPTKCVCFPLATQTDLKRLCQVLLITGEETIDGDTVIRFKFSDYLDALLYLPECGIWAQLVPKGKNGKKMKGFKCDMGFVCDKHAKPFDYWYYRRLPRLLINDAFWRGCVNQLDSNDVPVIPPTLGKHHISRKRLVDEDEKFAYDKTLREYFQPQFVQMEYSEEMEQAFLRQFEMVKKKEWNEADIRAKRRMETMKKTPFLENLFQNSSDEEFSEEDNLCRIHLFNKCMKKLGKKEENEESLDEEDGIQKKKRKATKINVIFGSYVFFATLFLIVSFLWPFLV